MATHHAYRVRAHPFRIASPTPGFEFELAKKKAEHAETWEDVKKLQEGSVERLFLANKLCGYDWERMKSEHPEELKDWMVWKENARHKTTHITPLRLAKAVAQQQDSEVELTKFRDIVARGGILGAEDIRALLKAVEEGRLVGVTDRDNSVAEKKIDDARLTMEILLEGGKEALRALEDKIMYTTHNDLMDKAFRRMKLRIEKKKSEFAKIEAK
ncbi:MAG: hypothetical protein AB1468_05135 [Candidatus Micrarchaeota archaeon]